MKHVSIAKLFSGLGLVLALIGTTTKADEVKAVYTMDNAAGGNHVLVFQSGKGGQIHKTASVATGGAGTGGGLSSQGSVLLSQDGRWLLACNPGSDEISVFATGPKGLQLVDKVNSGGHRPVSLAMHENLVYALNAGGAVGDQDNVTAFLLVKGRLIDLPGSTRALSSDNTTPGQVSFTQDGNVLIVTEEGTDVIDTFTIGDDGAATSHNVSHQAFQSQGHTPFGFAVGRGGRLFVSNANGGVANGSSVSTYRVSDDGDLDVLGALAPTKQGAACWLTLSPDEQYVYTANAASGTLSGFSVGQDGALKLLAPSGVTAVIGAGSHPVDLAESANGKFLFALANGNGTLNTFHVTADGSLEPLGFISGIPTSASGLAVQ